MWSDLSGFTNEQTVYISKYIMIFNVFIEETYSIIVK